MESMLSRREKVTLVSMEAGNRRSATYKTSYSKAIIGDGLRSAASSTGWLASENAADFVNVSLTPQEYVCVRFASVCLPFRVYHACCGFCAPGGRRPIGASASTRGHPLHTNVQPESHARKI